MRFDTQQRCAPHWAPFADAGFQLAHWLRSEDCDGRWLRCQCVVEPGSDPAVLVQNSLAAYAQLFAPPHSPESLPQVIERNALPASQWQAKVANALQAIDNGDLSKVVLARHVEYQLNARSTAVPSYAGCTSGAAKPTCSPCTGGDSCFMGATPERLLSCQESYLSTHALAGSARRAVTPEEDLKVGADLLADPKELHEHQLVLQTILQGRSLLDGIQALHPTPAAGGLPGPAAMSFIRHTKVLTAAGTQRPWAGWTHGATAISW